MTGPAGAGQLSRGELWVLWQQVTAPADGGGNDTVRCTGMTAWPALK
jgi:hypothetical protein